MSDDTSPHEPAGTPPMPPPPVAPADAAQARTLPNVNVSGGLVAGLVAVAGIVLALFLNEEQTSLWDLIGELWSIVAIVAAVVTLLPALRTIVNLDERRAWLAAAIGGGFLVLWWVLFVLPRIAANVSFLATVAVGAAVFAVWTSPGNSYRGDSTS